MSHGVVCWSELNTHDAQKAKQFYGATLGWSFDSMPLPDGGTYWLIKMGDHTVGGLFEMKGPDFAAVPDMWMTYIAVDDVDARIGKAKAAGGQLARPIWDIDGVGRIALLKEPGGAMVCWMTPKPQS